MIANANFTFDGQCNCRFFGQTEGKIHGKPEAYKKDRRKINADHVEFYDYYQPFLDGQEATHRIAIRNSI